MKIICFIVVLIEITKKVHSLQCHVNKQTEEPKPTDCDKINNKFCAIAAIGNMTARGCMPDGQKVSCTNIMMDGEKRRTCYCQTKNCNENFESCLKQNNDVENCTEKTTTTKTTAGNSQNNQNSTIKEDQNPIEDNTIATGEDNKQSTGDDAEATKEKDEETQTPTGEPAATSGNQRVVKSNQLVFILLVLVTLIIKSL